MVRAINDVRDQIRVREHHSLRLARRARSVDDGRQIFRLDDARQFLSEMRTLCAKLAPALFQFRKRQRLRLIRATSIEEDDLLQRRAIFESIAGLLKLRAILNEENARAGVSQDISDLRGRQGRIDWNVNHTGEEAASV